MKVSNASVVVEILIMMVCGSLSFHLKSYIACLICFTAVNVSENFTCRKITLIKQSLMTTVESLIAIFLLSRNFHPIQAALLIDRLYQW